MSALRAGRGSSLVGWGRRLGVVGFLLLQVVGCRSQRSGRPESGSGGAVAEPSAEDPATLGQQQAARPEGGVAVDLARDVRYLGRYVPGEKGVSYAWSGAGFAVRFSGTGLSATLGDPGTLHSVVVDEQRVRVLTTRPGEREYVIAMHLPPGEHVVRLERSSEAFLGPTNLLGISVLGGTPLPPPAPKDRLLEVIGDSISCGYGNLGKDPSCPFSKETEDHFLSYGRLLAEALGADISTVAWSGRGVVKNYDGEAAEVMPELYPRAIPQEASSFWDFSRPADLVVVNLGTNDFSTEPDPSIEEFSGAYQGLLESVRQKNPQAIILATVGPMLGLEDRARAEAAIEEAVRARRALGDELVRFHSLRTANADPGCHFHPGLATHRAMAQELHRVFSMEPAEAVRASHR